MAAGRCSYAAAGRGGGGAHHGHGGGDAGGGVHLDQEVASRAPGEPGRRALRGARRSQRLRNGARTQIPQLQAQRGHTHLGRRRTKVSVRNHRRPKRCHGHDRAQHAQCRAYDPAAAEPVQGEGHRALGHRRQRQRGPPDRRRHHPRVLGPPVPLELAEVRRRAGERAPAGGRRRLHEGVRLPQLLRLHRREGQPGAVGEHAQQHLVPAGGDLPGLRHAGAAAARVLGPRQQALLRPRREARGPGAAGVRERDDVLSPAAQGDAGAQGLQRQRVHRQRQLPAVHPIPLRVHPRGDGERRRGAGGAPARRAIPHHPLALRPRRRRLVAQQRGRHVPRHRRAERRRRHAQVRAPPRRRRPGLGYVRRCCSLYKLLAALSK